LRFVDSFFKLWRLPDDGQIRVDNFEEHLRCESGLGIPRLVAGYKRHLVSNEVEKLREFIIRKKKKKSEENKTK